MEMNGIEIIITVDGVVIFFYLFTAIFVSGALLNDNSSIQFFSQCLFQIICNDNEVDSLSNAFTMTDN